MRNAIPHHSVIVLSQVSHFKGVMARSFYRNESAWVQSHTRAKLLWKQTNGFVQHLEPRACVSNDSVVYPSHMRSIKKNLRLCFICYWKDVLVCVPMYICPASGLIGWPLLSCSTVIVSYAYLNAWTLRVSQNNFLGGGISPNQEQVPSIRH
jgi:hypothetical protein